MWEASSTHGTAGEGAGVGVGPVLKVAVPLLPVLMLALERATLSSAPVTEMVPPFQPSPNESIMFIVCAPGLRQTGFVYSP